VPDFTLLSGVRAVYAGPIRFAGRRLTASVISEPPEPCNANVPDGEDLSHSTPMFTGHRIMGLC
jgi:hypothetical protein